MNVLAAVCVLNLMQLSFCGWNNEFISDISTLSCNFEDGDLCGWENEPSNVVNWKVVDAADESFFNFVAAGSGFADGSMALLDTKSASPGDMGGLTTPLIPAGGLRCLIILYKEITSGPFRVLLEKQWHERYPQILLHSQTVDQGLTWHQATVSLLSDVPYRIKIEHARGELDQEAGVAIKDISFVDQPC